MRAKALIPAKLQPLARDIYHRLYRLGISVQCRYLDWRARDGETPEALPLPPAMLRFRVGETVDVNTFNTVGRETAKAIEAALTDVGRPFETFDSVLDFGCGCGRTLVWFLRKFPGKRIHGSDVDKPSIDWCRSHLGSGHFSVNGVVPPLDSEEAAFDLVYGISVFTHLSEEHQLLWLTELHRVIRPGGILILSLHGKLSQDGLSPQERADIEQNGLLFKTSSKLSGIVPDWYHTAYHSREHTMQTFSRLFTTVAYLEAGLGYQDLMILRR